MNILAAINPVAFTIGSLEVRWYGIVIVCGMILGLLYACSQITKINMTSDDAIELFLWIIPLAVIFCRIFYVFPARIDEYFPWNSWGDFINAIAIWDGGITIIGGLIGGILGGIFFTLRHKKQTNFGNVADLVVVPLLIGQIIGRLGNFFNQEAFGIPITNAKLQCFPFGVYITKPSGYSFENYNMIWDHINAGRAAGGEGNWFCATFFYEEVWNFIGMCFCLYLWKKEYFKKYPGILLIFYLFWYCLGRFWLEFLRMDAVPVTKVACICVAPIALVFGIVYIIARNSQLSYRMVRSKVEGKGKGALKDVPLLEYDIKNYKFVGKVLSSDKNILKFLYDNDDYIEIDFDIEDYYHVRKDYKKSFNKIKKGEEYFIFGK